MDYIVINATDGLKLSCIYAKCENAKGCVQIIHGMIEHKERYFELINRLNAIGYSVIISDTRGHGKSINEKYPLGHVGCFEELVSDQYQITKFIKDDNPNMDLYIFAHSMGTLIARSYLMKHDDEIKKMILCGTVSYNPGVGLAVFLSKLFCKLSGEYKYSKLLYAFSNNMSFKDDLSWLSYNENNINEYKNNPLCSFKFDNCSNRCLFTLDKNLKKFKLYECKNPDLEILSISGKDDRTTGGTKKLNKTMKLLKKIGYQNIKIIEYDNMKHEILNEEKHENVILDIIEFYKKK